MCMYEHDVIIKLVFISNCICLCIHFLLISSSEMSLGECFLVSLHFCTYLIYPTLTDHTF